MKSKSILFWIIVIILALAIIFISFRLRQASQDNISSTVSSPARNASTSLEQSLLVASEEKLSGPEAVFNDSEIHEKGKFFVRADKPIGDDIKKKISTYYIKPGDMFSPEISFDTNLIASPIIEEGKTVYRFDLIPGKSDVYVGSPTTTFDFRRVALVEYDTGSNRIWVNKDQVLDFQNVVDKVKDNDGSSAQTRVWAQSLIRNDIYDFSLSPKYHGLKMEFDYKGKESEMIIESGVKISNHVFSLLKAGQEYEVKLLPQEIYAGVFDYIAENPKIKLQGLGMKAEEGKALYVLSVEEPFKLFWFYDMTIKSQYFIGAGANNVIDITDKKPWYSWFGMSEGMQMDKIMTRIVGQQ